MKRAMRDQIREPAASHPSCTAASLRHLLATLPPQFAGEAEHTLTASVELIATVRERKPWSRPPLSMNFQVGWAAHLLRPVFFQFVSIPAGVPAAAHELPGDGLVCVGGCVARLLQPVSNSRQLLPASILLLRCWAASATRHTASELSTGCVPILNPLCRCRCTARAACGCSTSKSGRRCGAEVLGLLAGLGLHDFWACRERLQPGCMHCPEQCPSPTSCVFPVRKTLL